MDLQDKYLRAARAYLAQRGGRHAARINARVRPYIEFGGAW